jgi:hypothetical protein
MKEGQMIRHGERKQTGQEILKACIQVGEVTEKAETESIFALEIST